MELQNPNLFVLSGGPGSGKTTLLRELARLGFPHVPEVARQIIQEQVEMGGAALPWADRESYAYLMLQRSIESYLEHVPGSRPAFADRGIPDTLAYARLIGMTETDLMERACRQYLYAPMVVLAPPWQEIYVTDRERKQDFAEAERTFDRLTEVYREFGYGILVLPKISPSARAEWVLERLHLADSCTLGSPMAD